MECRRGIAIRKLSVRLSVSLSVGPSVKRAHCYKTEERSVQIFIPYEFLRRRMVGAGDRLLRVSEPERDQGVHFFIKHKSIVV